MSNNDYPPPPQYQQSSPYPDNWSSYPQSSPYPTGTTTSTSAPPKGKEQGGYSYPEATPVYMPPPPSANATPSYHYHQPPASTSPRYGSTNNEDDDIPDDFHYGGAISSCSKSIRMAFLRKVYLILFAQIALTCGMSALFMFVEDVKTWVQANYWIVWVNFIPTIIVLCIALWKRRVFPINMILLIIFTLLEAYTIGVIVSFYDVEAVLQAFLITLGVFFGITLFTFQTKWDFTWLGPILFASLFGMLMAGLLMLFFPYNEIVTLIWCCFGVIIFTGLILFDTHMIMKKYSPEEYIAAALNLYLDIINLFLFILRIIGIARN